MRYLPLLAFLAITFAAAALGAQFKPGSWYAGLVKPSWTPPNWLFGPVWTALYVMIAVAGWLVWRTGRGRVALGLWSVGLTLNAAWSWLFFGQQRIGTALIDIAALWLSIATFVVVARPVSGAASALFVHYLVWVSFATALNVAIWQLNG